MKDYKIMSEENSDAFARRIAKLTGDITGAELKKFFISALKLAVEKRSIDEDDRVILSYEIFRNAKEKIGIGQKRLPGFV